MGPSQGAALDRCERWYSTTKGDIGGSFPTLHRMKGSPADAAVPKDTGRLHLLKGSNGVEIKICTPKFAMQAKWGPKMCYFSKSEAVHGRPEEDTNSTC